MADDLFTFINGVDINLYQEGSRSPLHCAVSKRNAEAVKTLIEEGADLEAKDSKGCTALEVALRYGHGSMVELLIDLGADVNIRDQNEWTVLHYASLNGWLRVAQSLMEKDVALNTENANGATPLFLAAMSVHKEVVELLLHSGAKVHCSAFEQTEWSVLLIAAHCGWIEVVQSLVKTKADLNYKNSAGSTPLSLAAEGSHKDMFQLLIDMGADITVIGGDGWTMLHHAAFDGWLEVVQSLLDKGADIDARNWHGATPLHLALEESQVEVAEHLLQAGADFNAEDENSVSPFTCIMEDFPSLSLVVLCVEKGAFLKPADYKELTGHPVMEDAKLCTQLIINKYNNKDLPALYRLPSAVVRSLPPIAKMKIAGSQSVVRDIEQAVEHEIEEQGHCDLSEANPMVLSVMCVNSIIAYWVDVRKKWDALNRAR